MRAGKDSIQNLLSDKYIEICIDKTNVNFTPVSIRKDTFDVIEAGMQPKVLQKLLGHGSIKTTMDRYVHVTADSMDGAIKPFENNQVL